MIENADFVAINNREFKLSTTQWYTTLKTVKDRAGRGELTYVAQPCDPDMSIRILEDADGEALYRESVSEMKAGEVNFESDEESDSNRGRRGKKTAKKKKVEEDNVYKVESIESLDDL